MRRILLMTAFAAAAATVGSSSAWAQMPGGGPMSGGRPGSAPPSQQIDTTTRPDKQDAAARKAYREAVKALNKAMDYDQLALKAPNADKRANELDKARDSYYQALDYFTEALSNNAEMSEAWNSAGTCIYALVRMANRSTITIMRSNSIRICRRRSRIAPRLICGSIGSTRPKAPIWIYSITRARWPIN